MIVPLSVLLTTLVHIAIAQDVVPSTFIGRGMQAAVLGKQSAARMAQCVVPVMQRELHVVSMNNGFGAAVDIEVDRVNPVVLVVNTKTSLQVLQIRASAQTTIERVYVMTTSPMEASAVVGVDISLVTMLNQFPWTPFNAGFDIDDTTVTSMLIPAAEHLAGASLTSFHGAAEVATLTLNRADEGAPACKTCGDNLRIDAVNDNCVCELGFSGDDCQETKFSLTASKKSVSSDIVTDFQMSVAEKVPYGVDMTCKLGSTTYEAYWRADNTVACVIQPGTALKPNAGGYQLTFFAQKDLAGSVLGDSIDVFNGAEFCAMADSCGNCPKDSCVYCVDGERSCVPGTARFGPAFQCNNWFSRSCPDFDLTLGGAPQRAVIQNGVTHSYTFTVPAGNTENIQIELKSFPRLVQQNTVASIYLRKGQAPDPDTPGSWDHVFASNPSQFVPKGDFELRACDLTQGKYYIAIRSTATSYQYDISLAFGCGCPNDPANGAAVPQLTGLSQYAGPMILPESEVRTVDVQGTNFNDEFKRLTCRFDMGNDIYLYSKGVLSAGAVQCSVPSFDEAPDTDIAFKAPNAAKVSVSNDQCNWSTDEIYYSQYLDLSFNSFGGRGIRDVNIVDSSQVAPLRAGASDLYRLDLSDGGRISLTFVARLLKDGGPLKLYVFQPQHLSAFGSGNIECDAGGVRCGVKGEGSLSSQWSLTDCNLEAGIWYMAVQNAGLAISIPYTVGIECGCGSEPLGRITNLSPPYGAVEGYDFITVTGVDFRKSNVASCKFGNEVLTAAQYISPTEVQCITPPQTSAIRPAEVDLSIVGSSRAVGTPCSTTETASFNYFVLLNIGQEYKLTLQADRAAYFMFDSRQVSTPQIESKKRQMSVSFRAVATPKSAINKLSLAVASGKLPEKPSEDPDVSDTGSFMSEAFCAQSADQQWFIGLWSGSGEIDVTVKVEFPPECEGVTAAPTTAPITTIGETITTGASHVGVATIACFAALLALLF